MAEALQKNEAYKRRAKVGELALIARTALAQLIILAGTVILARQLEPAEFGVFAMVQFVLLVLTIFGDGGLAGALVQRDEPPSEEQLSSVFWGQLIVTVPVMAAAWLLGHVLPFIWPDLTPDASWLLLALAANFVFVSARVVPTLLLERELLFVRVAVIDTVGSIAFYGCAAVLSLLDFGVWSLVLGILSQGALSLVCAFLLRPWRPRFSFRWHLVRDLLGFGLPFQARTGLHLLTKSVIPVVAGTMFGSRSVGLLNWAMETSFFSLTFIEIIRRVSFPLLSRLQGDPTHFQQEVQKSLRVGVALTLYLSAMFIGLAHDLTEVIYSAQWLPAVDQLRLYAVTVILANLLYMLAPAFDAMGKPRPLMMQNSFVVVMIWILSPIGGWLWQEEGFALGHLLAEVLGAFVLLYLARQVLPGVSVLTPYFRTGIAAVVVALVGHFVLTPWVDDVLTLVAAVVTTIALFLALLWLCDRQTFDELRSRLPHRAKVESTPEGAP